ncbi:MAG: leucine--tRNA ligase [Acidilobaceae archaeon]|nr:leucine--tRNA ligase [Acidilobaceae archaeon]
MFGIDRSLYGPKVERPLVERLKSIEAKWREKWASARLFEADPSDKPKFFVTFPYPYVNAYPHLGSAFTILRVDVTARYKRMRGYNVLFAQGWHATGGPIVSAALRVREGDPKVLRDLKLMGVKDVDGFENPEHWVTFFKEGWKRDLQLFGMSIDWRREFFTTYLNPPYSKFIEWQYYKLREKGLVAIGEHPVVWCPREQKVVGDHDRPDEYAGIGPSEATVIKFYSEDGLVFPALTYRPETIFGATNIWVNPQAIYVIARVGEERWVIGEYGFRELVDQGVPLSAEGKVSGRELLGKRVRNPADGRPLPLLPAAFVEPDVGTGVVMSVPAHAPYDYVALKDLKEACSGPYCEEVKRIEPIVIISSPSFKGIPAQEACEQKGVRSQLDKEALDEATKLVYAEEFYKGQMLVEPWAGVPVKEAKEEIAQWLASKGAALQVHTLPQRVYCRCGARTHVKKVKDQWFLLYSSPEWKRLALEALKSMKVWPEEARREMIRIAEWFRDWAFTHKGELGTRLPWSPEWVIESLSDSTVYMAYYTIAKYLQHPEKYGIRPEQLVPELFDYVFLGQGSAEEVERLTGIKKELVEEMRREFLYWYPVDLRISGKDLMYNHLVFFVFHHVALFPRELWPRGISVNGWINVGGEKMSKSKGNFILLRQAIDWWGADATRWAEIMAGADSTLDDPNFDPATADAAVRELSGWLDFVAENYGKGREERMKVDDWFESVLNEKILRVTQLMEETMYKSALMEGYYDLQSKFKWYLRRAGSPHREVLKRFIEVQTLLMAPFAPHVAEEAWEIMGKQGFISVASWPEADKSKIREELHRAEEIVRRVLEDAREVLRLVRTAKKLRVTVAAPWKYELCKAIAEELPAGQAEAIRRAIKRVSGVEPRQVAQAAQRVAASPEILQLLVPRDLEHQALKEAEEFLSRELGLQVTVELEEESSSPKRGAALPAKPALYAE